MSTTTDPTVEQPETTATRHSETAVLTMMVCPTDGQILSEHHASEEGRIECPCCDHRWTRQEVLV